ncbi:MAG: shikimate kinase [Phycisphaerae bacterium]|nr:shikimate kinase [Phycisphaerae bacterium]
MNEFPAHPTVPTAPGAPHCCLIGLRGAGKTTIGQLLAQRLGIEFFDLDDLALRRLGHTSVTAVFSLGEPIWRAAEAAAAKAFFQAPLAPAVLALGGGAPLVPSIAALLKERRDAARVIMLDCGPATAEARLHAGPGDRTSITGLGVLEELQVLALARRPRYLELADAVVDVNAGTPGEIADRVASAFRQAARSSSSQPSPR